MGDHLTDPIDDVTTSIVVLAGIDEDEWTRGTVTDLARTLDKLRDLQSVVRHAQDAVEWTLVESMETDTVDVPGIGRITRVERNQSKWRDGGAAERMRDDLARAVATTVAIDIATGDIDPMKRNIALHTMRTAYEAIPSFSSLLKAGRERLGLQVGDYREYSTHYTIGIEGNDK